MHADVSNEKGMLRGDGAPAHDGCDHGNLSLFHDFLKDFVGVGDVDAAAGEEERFFGFMEHFQGFLELSHMDAGAGLVTADVDCLRVFRAAEFCHDILRKVDEDRARTAGTGDVKGLLDDAAQVFPVPYGDTVFGDAAGDAHDIDLLESVISDEVPGYLACEAYERHAVIVCGGKTCHQVGGSRAAGHQTDADFSCGPGVGVSLVYQSLLVAGKDNVDPVLFVKFIADINGTGARIAEKGIHPFLLQGLYQKFVS